MSPRSVGLVTGGEVSVPLICPAVGPLKLRVNPVNPPVPAPSGKFGDDHVYGGCPPKPCNCAKYAAALAVGNDEVAIISGSIKPMEKRWYRYAVPEVATTRNQTSK